MPPKRYRVICKVISQQGTCSAGHKVGDEWVIEKHTPAGMCLGAFYNAYPNIKAMMFGAQLTDNPEVAPTVCPDSKNPLKMEIRRGTEIK